MNLEPDSLQGTTVQQKSSAPLKEDDDDDDIDLFGSDEDEEAEKLKEQRLKEYAEKKAKKPAVIAKSSILLDVKPVSSVLLPTVCPLRAPPSFNLFFFTRLLLAAVGR